MHAPTATATEISDRVIKLAAEQLGIEEGFLGLDSNLVKDFNMDSLDRVEFGMLLEDEFGIEIPDDVLVLPATINDFISIVNDPSGFNLRQSQM